MHMLADDAELLRRYADERAEEAFAELVRRYVDLVYHAALRQLGGDAHRAHDVTQTVFALLAHKARSLRRHAALAGWLHTTTRLSARRMVRTEQRRLAREHEAQLMHQVSGETPASDAAWQQLRPVIDEALGELGDADRAAVLLRFFAARPLAEVGAKLGLTENAARMRVERALDKLRARLARRGITSTSAALGLVLAGQAASAAPAGLAVSVTAGVAASSQATPLATVVLQLMSTTKFAAALAVLALLLLTGVARWNAQAALAAEAAQLAEARGRAALQGQARALRQELDAAEAARGAAQRSLDEAHAQAAVATTASPPVHDPVMTGRNVLAAHPDGAGLVAEITRLNTTHEYQILFHRLGLTPAQIDAFHELMRQWRAGVRWNTSRQAPFAQIALGELSREQMESGVRAILGEAGYREYQDYRRTQGARSLAQQVAAAVYASSEPLTAEQANHLVKIAFEESAYYRNERDAKLSATEWNSVMARAREILSPAQLEALAGLQRKREFQEATHAAVAQAQAEAKRAAGVPANF
jgi:RNA polymerase sigma factor (sigma-70 family)